MLLSTLSLTVVVGENSEEDGVKDRPVSSAKGQLLTVYRAGSLYVFSTTHCLSQKQTNFVCSFTHVLTVTVMSDLPLCSSYPNYLYSTEEKLRLEFLFILY